MLYASVLFSGLAVQGVVQPAPGAVSTSPAGYNVNRFAGRYALGKNLPAVDKKKGFAMNRVDSGEVRVLGGACSEVLGGANLANLLRDGFELEERAMAALRNDEPAETLSIHTSAGVPPQLNNFIAALEPHLPTTSDDWALNLQAEGGAVHAAIDMAPQVFQGGQDLASPTARTASHAARRPTTGRPRRRRAARRRWARSRRG